MSKKPVIIDNKETNYEIYSNGDCYNKKLNRFLKGSIKNSGYKMYLLSLSTGKKLFSVHRLVAEAFIPNPDNKEIVNHIDGNKLNNDISNLEWVSQQENRIHALEHNLCTLRGVQHKYKSDLPNEKWKRYLDTNYLVSDLGRVRNIKNDNILKGSVTNDGYQRCTLRINNKSKAYLLHRLIYFTFNPDQVELKNYVINHIDGNKQNNHLNNLEYISQSENTIHGKYQLKNKNTKKCYQYDLNNNLINEYPSISLAAAAVNGTPSGISQVCNGKSKSYKGYRWKFEKV